MTVMKLIAAASAATLLTALPACAEDTESAEGNAAAANAANSESAASGQAGAMQADRAEARATIINRDREEVGTATFQQGPDGVVVTIEADLGEGTGQWHGAHLHKIGDCSNPDFTSSGGHINPDGNAHGFLNGDGPDNADLPNLWLHSDGTLRAQAYTTRVSIDGQTDAPALLDADGSALVIHENRDDMESQPIGGAGARILCGVVEAQ
ncbi:MAG: superoxide dismutase family protein [Oceanicaulis sp.]